MIAALACLSAFAAPSEPEKPGVEVVLRGLVERWSDPSLATVYRSGAWLGGLGVVAPVIGPVALDLELSYSRLQGTGTTLEVAPLSAMIELGAPIGAARAFVGAGPTLTLFTERAATVTDGARLAAELRGGVRFDTGLVDPPMAPAKGGPVRKVDVELYLARRSQLPGGPDGFVLGAWRASLGLGLAF